MSEASVDPLPQKIGKYQILSKIGEGGFGVVYKGRDPFIKRTVAVKTCVTEQDTVRKRFFREAEIAGNLRHDNVVTIHDFGVHEDVPFLVQEFLTGEDLDVLIRHNYDALDMAFKVRCLREISEGLRYAHQQGVIHRDIKPANIRVLQSGRIKVMDFGIARLKDQQTQLTKTGMTLGTVSYLSPEQLRGDEVDHRVDIFSFGVLAYELLSAKKPFEAKSISNLFFKLLHEDAPPLDVADLPPGLAPMVMKSLAKDADDRYPSFAEIVEELHEIQVAGGYVSDPSGIPGQGLPDATDTVREALRAGELTAAEFSLDLARRQMGNSSEFDRRFGTLQKQLDELKSKGNVTVDANHALPLQEAERRQVLERIAKRDFTGAEKRLVALSGGRRGNVELEDLWQQLREARTPSAGELSLHGLPPTSGAWFQSRQNQFLALGVAAVFILLLLIVWFLARGPGSAAAKADPPPAAAIPADPVVPPPGRAPEANTDPLRPSAPAEGVESNILEPAQTAPAAPKDDITFEEWPMQAEPNASPPPPGSRKVPPNRKDPPLEEFSG